jgi:imidazole glycerol-phosphate synthase subunit HisH
MSTSIALIDYGAGNLTSVRKGFAAVGAELTTPREPGDLSQARAIVVPGVGHFQATTPLGGEWRQAILRAVDRGTPLFGICLGLQWLFDASTEAEDVPGLGLMPGRCERLPSTVKVPHVGWNSLATTRPSRLLEGIPEGAQVYFTHSFAAPVTGDCVASSTHGRPFAAAVERDRICGVQFHPEKSGDVGLRIIRNFLTQIAA